MIETLGRYKILSIIGQGAMGVVYKAVDPMIDRTVAIKTVNLNLSRDEIEEFEARFQQEIKAAGRLNHPNIVTIYDVGRNENMAYMAMEFLDGKELKDILAESSTVQTVATLVDWIAQIALGLGFAHENDIIHRDVKPSNIMVVRGGYAKITDFGIARMPSSAVKTMTGLILGSPRYMSPEQVIGRALDHRTDIFSLGVVLYEALTGTPPFDGDNVNAIMYATVNATPPSPSSTNANVPPMLDLVIAKALAKSVDERYQSMLEFSGDLQEVKRLLISQQPGGKIVASQAPTPSKTVSLDALGIGRYQKKDEAVEEAKPLKIARAFDSFDATLKLAAMTNQTAEFDQYISDTKKMKAYKGAITGVLGAQQTGTKALDASVGASRPSIGTSEVPYIAPALSRPAAVSADTITRKLIAAPDSSASSTKIHLVIIVSLAILVLVLSIYLLVK
ncbi:MAG: serine/threonine-protein kinase [Betaproteobacteria bacterium]